MSEVKHKPPSIEKMPDLGDNGNACPPVKYMPNDGLPDNVLQYVGGPRDGGGTPASAEMTSFEDHLGRIHHYRLGLSPSGRQCYLYEDYRWDAL